LNGILVAGIVDGELFRDLVQALTRFGSFACRGFWKMRPDLPLKE